jgi:cob(I)alamin adenosyltransferase
VGNRLSKIYTRTGDDGTTGLGDGTRVHKCSARVEAYGCVDELNSALGVTAAAGLPAELAELIAGIQQKLFDLGGELCIPGAVTLGTQDVESLEISMDQLNESLAPLEEFILPGGSPTGAACHLARAICRRTERRVLHLAAAEDVNPASVHYLNRLSDLLFVVARTLNNLDDGKEIMWTGGRLKKPASDA